MLAASLLLPCAFVACLWLIPASRADFTNFCVQAQYALGTCADSSVIARDLVFVLDKSASMNLTYVNYNALDYCQQLYCGFDGTAGSQVGLITFGYVALCSRAHMSVTLTRLRKLQCDGECSFADLHHHGLGQRRRSSQGIFKDGQRQHARGRGPGFSPQGIRTRWQDGARARDHSHHRRRAARRARLVLGHLCTHAQQPSSLQHVDAHLARHVLPVTRLRSDDYVQRAGLQLPVQGRLLSQRDVAGVGGQTQGQQRSTHGAGRAQPVGPHSAHELLLGHERQRQPRRRQAVRVHLGQPGQLPPELVAVQLGGLVLRAQLQLVLGL